MHRFTGKSLTSQDSILLSSSYKFLLVVSLFGLIFSGIFKALFQFVGIEVFDITVLSSICIIVLLCMQFKYQLNKDGINLILILGLFSFFYIFSWFYSPSYIYGPEKLVKFIGVLFCFFVGLILPVSVRELSLKVIPWFGIVISASFIVLMTSNLEALNEYDLSGIGLVAGEILGLGIIISSFKKDKSIIRRLGILFSFCLVLLLGARGPLLFVLFIWILIVLESLRTNKDLRSIFLIHKKTFYFVILGIFGVAGIMAALLQLSETSFYDFLQSGISRFLLLFETDKGDSVNFRLQMISDAIYYINQSPIFGHGLGSYGVVVYSDDLRGYPHNGLLEIWFEGGIFSLATFIAFISMSLFAAKKRNQPLLIYLIIFLMLNFLKSNSLDELRILFLLCGFAASFFIHNQEQSN